LYSRHLALMVVFDCYVPKHHLLVHLLHDVPWMGNPIKYSTWLDESLNKTLKQACKNASAATFECTVLLRMRDILSRPRPTKRAR
jgi:hypothetical protein